jgi:hypothetical protein
MLPTDPTSANRHSHTTHLAILRPFLDKRFLLNTAQISKRDKGLTFSFLIWAYDRGSVDQSSLQRLENTSHYLFLWGEIIDNVKEFPNLLGCLAFDHVSDSLAAHVAVDDIRKG